LICFIPESTHTNGRRAKIKAPPKIKVSRGIIINHMILLQITVLDVKKKRGRFRALKIHRLEVKKSLKKISANNKGQKEIRYCCTNEEQFNPV
jgi:hypothetical protein